MSSLAALGELDHPGGALRERRIELGWTQAELAERAGVPQADISRIENGRLDPRWSTIHRLWLALQAADRPKRSLANGNRRKPPPAARSAGWSPTRPTLTVDGATR